MIATGAFFVCADAQRRRHSNPVPYPIGADQLHSDAAVKAGLPAPATVKHVFVKAAARLNNRAEINTQPEVYRQAWFCKPAFAAAYRAIKRRVSAMQGFQNPWCPPRAGRPPDHAQDAQGAEACPQGTPCVPC